MDPSGNPMATVIDSDSARTDSGIRPPGANRPAIETAGASYGDRSLLKIARHRWRYLTCASIVAIGVGVMLSGWFATTRWTVTSALLYERAAGGPGSSNGADVQSVRALMKSGGTLRELMEKFDIVVPLPIFDKMVQVEVPFGSNIIVTTLKWTDLTEAEAILNGLVEITRDHVADLRRQSLERQEKICLANLEQARGALVGAQHNLADFTNSADVIDVDLELTRLKDSMDFIAMGPVHESSGDGPLTLPQKARPNALLAAAIAQRARMNRAAIQLASRRQDIERLKPLREPIQVLTNELAVAEAARDRAELDLEAVQRSLAAKVSELSIVHPVQPGLEFAKSNQNKLFVGFTGLTAILLFCPLLVYDWRRTRPNVARELARRFCLPVLAKPSASERAAPPPLSDEPTRMLAHRLQQCVDQPGYLVMFTCMMAGESSTQLVLRVAETLSQRDQRIVIVDLDGDAKQTSFVSNGSQPLESERADQAAKTQLVRCRPGLGDYLSEPNCNIDRVVLPTDIPGVDYLSVGTMPRPREGLGTRRMSDLIEQMRRRYTMILVIGPPTSEMIDLELMAARADGIVLVASSARHADSKALQVVEELVAMNAPLLGIVD